MAVTPKIGLLEGPAVVGLVADWLEYSTVDDFQHRRMASAAARGC